jgi:NAD(P)H-dependent FMN reductase
MKTLILSSSLSKESKSFLLCKAVKKRLSANGINCKLVDARKLTIEAVHKKKTKDMLNLSKLIKETDNIIIGMGVHCYSINDNLKILLDNCFDGAIGKFFGILCAAGGEKSYLSTMHLTQICMNEWRMIQLPRIVYAIGTDFTNNKITSKQVIKRIEDFSNEFDNIGGKLMHDC